MMVVLSACSTISNYLPNNNKANQSQNSTGFEDTLNLTDSNDTSIDDVEVIDLNDDVVDDTVYDDVDTSVQPEDSFIATIDVIEGDLVSLSNLQAQDPDGDTIKYTFSQPLNAEGTWQTKDGDEGTYVVAISASDGLLSTTENIQIIVAPSNKGPVIDCPGSFALKEGTSVKIPCTIYDKEGDELSYEVTGYATDLSFSTGYEDAGTQSLTITATDGNKVSTKTVSLIISNVNRAPVVQPLSDITVLEGATIALDVSASDADGDGLELTYPLLFDADGRWKTAKGDAGSYELEVVVSDGEDDVVTPVKIIVEKVNTPPTLDLEESISVKEGEVIDLAIDASDEDGDDVSVSITGFMTSATYTTTYTDAGTHEVTVVASDGKSQTSKTVTITVTDVNRPPVFIFN